MTRSFINVKFVNLNVNIMFKAHVSTIVCCRINFVFGYILWSVVIGYILWSDRFFNWIHFVARYICTFYVRMRLVIFFDWIHLSVLFVN